jgi:CheY-like chemotaxis protein
MCFTIELKEASPIELSDPAVIASAPSSFRLLYALREFLSTLSSSQPITLSILVRKPKLADFLVRLFRKAENELNLCLIDQGALDNETVLISELIKHEATIVISDVLRHTEAMKRAVKEKVCKAVIFLDDQNDKLDLAEDRQFRSMRKPVKPAALIKTIHECLLGVLTANKTGALLVEDESVDRIESSNSVTEITPETPKFVATAVTSNFASIYPLHLMLAEDNLLNQQMMTRILAKYGYLDVVVADNGRQAVEAFAKLATEAKTPIDAIFMDMQMPEIEGPEAVHLIRTFCRQTGRKQPHVMALTARAFSEDRAECLRSGMCTYLSKPIRWPTLEEELIHAFQSARDKCKCVCNESRLSKEESHESASEEIGRSTGIDI